MAILRYLNKLYYIDNLIRKKATGNQKDFARKIGMSRSMLNEYIKEMKELGFPISYCRRRNTYYYLEDGHMVSNLFYFDATKDVVNANV